MLRGRRAAGLVAASLLLNGCAVVETTGTITRKTGEIMIDASKKHDGFFGTVLDVSGRINIAVGKIIEDAAGKGATDSSSNAPSGKTVSGTPTVARAQERLKELGYYKGRADGLTGKKTVAAIEKYQIANKLQVTRVFDQATLAALGIE